MATNPNLNKKRIVELCLLIAALILLQTLAKIEGLNMIFIVLPAVAAVVLTLITVYLTFVVKEDRDGIKDIRNTVSAKIDIAINAITQALLLPTIAPQEKKKLQDDKDIAEAFKLDMKFAGLMFKDAGKYYIIQGLMLTIFLTIAIEIFIEPTHLLASVILMGFVGFLVVLTAMLSSPRILELSRMHTQLVKYIEPSTDVIKSIKEYYKKLPS